MEVGPPRLRPHRVRWMGPCSYPPDRGTALQPPSFRPMSIVAKRSPISATAELLLSSLVARSPHRKTAALCIVIIVVIAAVTNLKHYPSQTCARRSLMLCDCLFPMKFGPFLFQVFYIHTSSYCYISLRRCRPPSVSARSVLLFPFVIANPQWLKLSVTARP